MKHRSVKTVTVMVLWLTVGYLFSVALMNGKPEVVMDEQAHLISSTCGQHSSARPIDNRGVLNLAVWNIYKQQKTQWQQTLTALEHDAHLILLQEAKLSPKLERFITSNGLHLAMAKAFKLFSTPVGVMNLSTESASLSCAFHAIEPWIRFAKSSLVSSYLLSNGQTLLVVNLHGINFDWRLQRYEQQWEVVAKKIALHQGPVILAGDFNTWRNERLEIVEELTARLKLKEARYKSDFRHRVFGYPLDHLYYRGLNLVHAASFKTASSDHNPIVAQFTLMPLEH
ncbi:endonuclease/exonuclease/phosphatase family protein [Shewanella colwelliana]|uniref:endonuclease/exonuclease/phosphatase family protein n=1 Tax=Shewanella colwelliana TaxID=23 RepID=UPI0022AF1386|nr:endonuclease/exonuclease/phosphatase family protein [Shewanella colwelliana]MCZ4338114.1 endonuclease/exonuclease/phosphatase family protein [Shewanella colwelliana]